MFIGHEKFEDRWNKLMEEFNLVNHKWLSKMYRLRSSWVLAFFVDSPLCGLMRTTSRSESENSFFSYFTSSDSTLVKFTLCYESAMKRQRHTQEKLDHQSFDSFPALLTLLPIEEHAAKVYTRSLFIRVQKEKIKPVGLPEVIDKESISENVEEEINLHQKVIGHYKVLYNKRDGSVFCCCQLFVCSGILCRHIFCVFNNFKLSCIPYLYILRRWTKDLIPPDLRNKKNRYGEKNEAIEKLAMKASLILDSCVNMLRNNKPKFSVFVNNIKAIKSRLETELPIVPTRTVSDFVQEFIGVKKLDKVKVKNPTCVRPKGRKKQKGSKSGREISMKKSVKKRNKKLNGCGVCGSTAHNRRTCLRKNDVDVLYPAVVVPGGSDHVDGGLRDEHAAKVYTCSLFIRVQKVTVAGFWLCLITGMSSDEKCTICIIDEEKIKPVGLPEVIDKESTSKNVEEEINLHQKVMRHYKYILRRWTKDLIPPDLRNKKNRYGEKNEAIEKLAMKASLILDSCVNTLRNNKPKFSVFVNNMKAIKSELETELPIVPTRIVLDFVQEFIGVKKPDKVKVKNPTCVRPKGLVVPGGSDHVDGGLRDGASGSVSV
nr:hypothetical protein [Tanacetum cinerariifolium]